MNNKKITRIIDILIFGYILSVYIWGGHSETTIYSELIFIVLAIFISIEIIKRKKFNIGKPMILVFFFVFFCFLSCFWAKDMQKALTLSKTLILLFLLFVLLWNYFLNTKNSKERILKILFYTGVIFALYVIFYYGISKFIVMLTSGNVRIGKEINNANTIGMQTGFSVIIGLYYFIYKKNKLRLVLTIFPLIVSLGTGSRKVIILIFLGVGLLYTFRFLNKKNLKNFISVFIGIIVILQVIKLPAFKMIFKRFENFTDIFSDTKEIDDSIKTRELFIKAGIDQFKQTPILGIGIGNSGYITQKAVGWTTYLHNNYVELLSCVGIIGFLLYYGMYVCILIQLLPKIKEKDEIAIIVFVITIINLILDYGMVSYYSKLNYIYLLLGFLTIRNDKKQIKRA